MIKRRRGGSMLEERDTRSGKSLSWQRRSRQSRRVREAYQFSTGGIEEAPLPGRFVVQPPKYRDDSLPRLHLLSVLTRKLVQAVWLAEVILWNVDSTLFDREFDQLTTHFARIPSNPFHLRVKVELKVVDFYGFRLGSLIDLQVWGVQNVSRLIGFQSRDFYFDGTVIKVGYTYFILYFNCVLRRIYVLYNFY